MSEHEQQPEHKPPFYLGRPSGKFSSDNPWLVALGAVAAITFFAGVVMYIANKPGAFDGSGDAGMQLIGAGVIAVALFLATSAICWQLRRS